MSHGNQFSCFSPILWNCFDEFKNFYPSSQEGCHFPHTAALPVTFLRNQTHFLASVFSNLTTRSEVARLLRVLLLPFQSWQGLPRAAQQGHLPPASICAQVLLIPPSPSTFPSRLLHIFSLARINFGMLENVCRIERLG